MDKQIKSSKRVKEHGEVYTSAREVNAMLDLVKEETERIESKFLEPSCGNGNFLVEILRRKLNVVNEKHFKNRLDYEKYSVLAVSNIYGVDILEDNIRESRERLFKLWLESVADPTQGTVELVKEILQNNIVAGNTLNCTAVNGEPLSFIEWIFDGNNLIRKPFELKALLDKE